ncbi:MAG: peptidase S8 and S53, subtilisin, kexin, sedolisin [Candidatus Ozemobacter sibiricus]|uniref:Peptidase S8 and S53, subtilisin, kexin, sedolisin n=1 Tax=Candidatus Ozemobacter sibiricus TaxID=2268124 RepID=A0A367ZN35_9BACT|nr:MAG: peptidase S8 and S53, subtilisin, kexin, sedolisin [Candidatus Ozemobacter sibiricus]
MRKIPPRGLPLGFLLTVMTVMAGALGAPAPTAADDAARPRFLTLAEAVDHHVVAERVAGVPAAERALAALRLEGSEVAQAILRVLDGRGRHVRPVWAARGVCVDLTDEELTRLLAEYPTLQAETIDQLAEPIMPWPRPGPSGPTMAPPAPNAWNLAMSGATALLQERGLTGQGVLIGVVGPDLPYLHPCLSGKIKHSKHFGDPKANTGTVEDLMLMHPLGVLAGFVKGRFQGVATGAVLSLATVTRGKLPTAELLAAIEWVLQPTDDPPPAAILLCVDFGGPAPKAVRQILAACRTAGVLPIIPAGNIPSRITGMAALPECLTIGALDQWKAKAGFSGTGPGVVEAVPIPKPDWAEPGVAIYGPNLEGSYRFGSGTLQAAAHFAGIWAQMREARPADDLETLLEALATSAIDLGAPGFDMETGRGLPNPSAALWHLENPPPPPAESWP